MQPVGGLGLLKAMVIDPTVMGIVRLLWTLKTMQRGVPGYS